MRCAAGLALAALAIAACTEPATITANDTARNGGHHAMALPDLPRSRIVLMSSLPLVYGDRADMNALIAGKGDPHPLYAALDAAHDLVVADVLDSDVLAKADLALLIQPRALPPQALVALDGYVRAGGKLLLFADPQLEWPSRLGLADPRGPVRSALTSPLLAHWGLELINPEMDAVTLPKSGAILHYAGQFVPIPGKTGDAGCMLGEGGYVARCRLGRGRAILVADADLLNPTENGGSAGSAIANERFVGGLLHDLLAGKTS